MPIRSRCLILALCLLALPRAGAFASAPLDPASAKPSEKGDVLFYDARALGVEGQGWTDTESPYDRLPAKAKGVVRDEVWGLGKHSAGMAVRFVTDATTISARWTVTKSELAMKHMPATGVSGLDLYVQIPDGVGGSKWRWLAVGQPTGTTTTAALVKGLPPATREYLLYLPLYNGTASLEIGIPKGKELFKPEPRPADKAKPIVFYGTSITQGGCASRPGMCHPAILGRRLDRPVINLGFSGNGRMEPEVAALLAELDPAVFVIDCLPNMSAEQVTERAGNLVKTIRKSHPETPILLVEDRTLLDGFLLEARRSRNETNRAALKAVVGKLAAEGVKNISYLPGEGLLAQDGEGTVDGSHPTDLGFVQHADAFEPVLRKMLAKKE